MRLSKITIGSVLALLSCGATLAQQAGSGIGYPSVAAALEAMKVKPGVRVSVKDGWTVIVEPGGLTVWTFTPPGHPAHPTAARREARQHADGSWHSYRRMLCQAPKAACDKIDAEFAELDNRIRENIRRERSR